MSENMLWTRMSQAMLTITEKKNIHFFQKKRKIQSKNEKEDWLSEAGFFR